MSEGNVVAGDQLLDNDVSFCMVVLDKIEATNDAIFEFRFMTFHVFAECLMYLLYRLLMDWFRVSNVCIKDDQKTTDKKI